MKIWVTGSRGMLGSHFIRTLLNNQISHVGTDLEVNITNPEHVENFIRKEKISHIVNCAAYTQVDKSETEKDLAFLVNAIGPKCLGKASKHFGIKIAHYSTDYVFNGNSHVPYRENHACEPLGVYGHSKWEGEKLLLQENEKACIIRTSWLFGLPGKNFVETMLRLMKDKEQLKVVHDQVGRPTYCQDLVDATLDILDEKGVFHFANANETSWYEFAQEIYRQAREMGGFDLRVNTISPIPTKEYPTPTQRPAYSSLNTEKWEKLVNKKPRPWQEGLQDYLNQYKLYLQKAQTCC